MGMNFFVVVVVVVDVVVKVIGGTWSWPRGGRDLAGNLAGRGDFSFFTQKITMSPT